MMTDFLCLDLRMGTLLMTMMMTMMMLRTSLKMRYRCSVCELLTLLYVTIYVNCIDSSIVVYFALCTGALYMLPM